MRPRTEVPATRREFLGGLATLGAAALVSGCSTPLRAMAVGAASPQRIDVHHHLSPPAYLAALKSKNLGAPPTFAWTPAQSLADMDRAGVSTAILSITTPAVAFLSGDEARRVARECNEYGARLAKDHPGRFGAFAALPLTDVDGSLREIEYALDTLKLSGIGLMTSYGDRYLGDPAFTPVFAELNRRKAVVYTHPTAAPCCRNVVPGVPVSIIEYATDTSRTIASWVFSGAAARHPDVPIIFSHGGGTMPFLTERYTRLPLADPQLAARVPDGVEATLKRFYYDTAQAAHPMALASLLKLVPITHVVFGTDFPFRTAEDHVKGLAAYGFSASDLRAIEADNALRLLPQLKA
jgi:6-methylsalicylate decarboxylase